MDIESATGGAPVRQFSVFLLNETGALLGVVRLLQDRRIHVLGLTVQDHVDVSVVRLVVSDPEAAETLFMERGIPFGVCDILVIELPEGVDDLHKSLHGLLTGETNINFLYPLLVRPKGKPTLALHVEDLDCAASVLGAQGFRLLAQSDLSR
ncbi:MAG: acetolactate synthase [Verrucomicrobiales bacterium]